MLPIRIARVRGRSTEPKLGDGTFVLFRRSKRVKRGDVVLVKHPELGWMVKRVGALAKNGRVALNGMPKFEDGSARRSSVDRSEVFGKPLMRIPLVRWRTGLER